jgi:hypothetical protein
MTKPIKLSEAAPLPWRIAESKSGHLYIYADGENTPIKLKKCGKRSTRRDFATVRLKMIYRFND